MRPTRVVLIVLAWVVVVALASTLVWAVISRAGETVVSQEPLVATTHASSPRPQTSGTGSPPTSSQRRTWQEYGMLLVAECDGSAIRRVSALPANGYIVETKDNGPEELELEFEGREDEEGTSVTVHARCVDGVPEFTSTEDDD